MVNPFRRFIAAKVKDKILNHGTNQSTAEPEYQTKSTYGVMLTPKSKNLAPMAALAFELPEFTR